ncbi:hypothetical protein GCM10023238_17780 [Streptomyces heliomycini]
MRDQLDKLLRVLRAGPGPHAADRRVRGDGPHPVTYALPSPCSVRRAELPEHGVHPTEYQTGALYLDSRKEVSAHLEDLDHMTARARPRWRSAPRNCCWECREHY